MTEDFIRRVPAGALEQIRKSRSCSVSSRRSLRTIGQRRNYGLISAAAIMNCLTGILEILLGVFTLIEINKPEVKQLFGRQ